MTGLDSAIEMLRPNAKWEVTNNEITVWDDPRPKPSMEEIKGVQERAKAFEDTLNTIWADDESKKFHLEQSKFPKFLI